MFFAVSLLIAMANDFIESSEKQLQYWDGEKNEYYIKMEDEIAKAKFFLYFG